MAACAQRRFGAGTPCTKPTVGSSELDAKLAELKAARDSLNAQMAPTPSESTQITPFTHKTQTQKTDLPPIFVPKVGTRGF